LGSPPVLPLRSRKEYNLENISCDPRTLAHTHTPPTVTRSQSLLQISTHTSHSLAAPCTVFSLSCEKFSPSLSLFSQSLALVPPFTFIQIARTPAITHALSITQTQSNNHFLLVIHIHPTDHALMVIYAFPLSASFSEPLT
jgi:hypothetical protein